MIEKERRKNFWNLKMFFVCLQYNKGYDKINKYKRRKMFY